MGAILFWIWLFLLCLIILPTARQLVRRNVQSFWSRLCSCERGLYQIFRLVLSVLCPWCVSYSSIGRNRWNRVTDFPGSGWTCMSAHLKRAQQSCRTRRGICFYEGVLVPGRLLNGSSWLYRCCHSGGCFILCHTSHQGVSILWCDVGSTLQHVCCRVFPYSPGQLGWPRRVSCGGSIWCTTTNQESRYKFLPCC